MALAKTAPTPTTTEEQIALLKQRVEESGMSQVQFAEEVLLRPGRTIRRWLAGHSPIPALVIDWLVKPRAAAWPPRR